MTSKKIEFTFSLNQYQIQRIRDWLEAEQDNLHDQRNEWGINVFDYDETHLAKYGTASYDEAQALLDDIKGQLPADFPVDNYLSQGNPWDTVTIGWCCTCGFHFGVDQQEWDGESCPKCASGDLGIAETRRDSDALCWITPREHDEGGEQYVFCRACVEVAGSLDRNNLRSTLHVSVLMPKINLHDPALICVNCDEQIPAEQALA